MRPRGVAVCASPRPGRPRGGGDAARETASRRASRGLQEKRELAALAAVVGLRGRLVAAGPSAPLAALRMNGIQADNNRDVTVRSGSSVAPLHLRRCRPESIPVASGRDSSVPLLLPFLVLSSQLAPPGPSTSSDFVGSVGSPARTYVREEQGMVMT
jgi:hypothetical protein